MSDRWSARAGDAMEFAALNPAAFLFDAFGYLMDDKRETTYQDWKAAQLIHRVSTSLADYEYQNLYALRFIPNVTLIVELECGVKTEKLSLANRSGLEILRRVYFHLWQWHRKDAMDLVRPLLCAAEREAKQ